MLFYYYLPSHLEEVGEDLGVDSLLEDDLEDGGTLTGEDVLTASGLAQGSRAALSSSPLVGIHSSGETLDVGGGALTQEVHQGLHRAGVVVFVVVAKLYRLTAEVGT